jgi:hypothetical protein
MKTLLLILLTTSAFVGNLKPNAALTFDFPELPNRLLESVGFAGFSCPVPHQEWNRASLNPWLPY